MSTLNVGTIKSISSAPPVFQNTSGTEKGQLAKAWVNFNGTGTVAIRDSFNVSSITDQGTGDYIVNLSANMSNANYSITSQGNYLDTDGGGRGFAIPRTQSTSNFQIEFYGDGGGHLNSERVFAAVHGDN